MVGHLFGDIFKLLISMVSIAILSALMNNKQAGIFEFVIMALLTGAGLALEIGNNFSNLSATSGDICYMLYCIDIEIERVYYQSSEPYSTPLEILYVLRPLMIQRNWNGRLP